MLVDLWLIVVTVQVVMFDLVLYSIQLFVTIFSIPDVQVDGQANSKSREDGKKKANIRKLRKICLSILILDFLV